MRILFVYKSKEFKQLVLNDFFECNLRKTLTSRRFERYESGHIEVSFIEHCDDMESFRGSRFNVIYVEENLPMDDFMKMVIMPMKSDYYIGNDYKAHLL